MTTSPSTVEVEIQPRWEGGQTGESQKTCLNLKLSGQRRTTMRWSLFYFFERFFVWFTGFRLWVIPALMICQACGRPQPVNETAGNRASPYAVRYARGFSLGLHGNTVVLNLIDRTGGVPDTISYLLKPSGNAPVRGKSREIDFPAKRVVLLHSSYIAYFDFCEDLSTLIGIADPDYVYLDSVKQLVQRGVIASVAHNEMIDLELLLSLDPGLVIDVGLPGTHHREHEVLEQWGIPVIRFGDWQETTALGRAEWVMAVAALLGKIETTLPQFDSVASRYLQIKKRVDENVDDRPAVLLNLPYKGVWHMPAGGSYMAGFIRNAGGSYDWENTPGTGALGLDLEAVYPAALDADVWINPGTARTLTEIVASDSRMADFRPLKIKKVYNCDLRSRMGGANDYWESGIVRPDLVLADLVSILHPELLQNHTLHYFRQLP